MSQDLLFLEITQLHKNLRMLTKVSTSLVNQGKAIGRSLRGASHKDDTLDQNRKGGAKIWASFIKVEKNNRKSNTKKWTSFIKESDDVPILAYGTAMPGISSLYLHAKESEKQAEKAFVSKAEELPLWEILGPIKGFGQKSAGIISAVAGAPLDQYSSAKALYSRFGLGFVNGERQRRTRDKELAVEMGYSPQRRKEAFLIADPHIRYTASPYRAVYLKERAKLEARIEVMSDEEREKYPNARIHKHAHRMVSKQILRDLWEARNGREISPRLVAA